MNARTLALIAAAMTCCSAAARGADSLAEVLPPAPLSLPGPGAILVLAAALVGLVRLGDRRP